MPSARHGGKRVQDIAAMIVTDASDCGDALGVIELFRSERMVVLPLALEALERRAVNDANAAALRRKFATELKALGG